MSGSIIYHRSDDLRQYRRIAHYNTTHRRRQNFYALRSSQWQMLADPPFSFLDTLNQVDDAIDANAEIADAILAVGLASFGLPTEPDPNSPLDWRDTASSSDISKAHSTIRQLYRDWSAEGIQERNACYDPVLQDLAHLFGNPPSAPMKVLIPGAGLGRLVFEVCRAGFSAEGNEISYHQLLTSSWVLNHLQHIGQYILYPFALQFSNLISRGHQLQKVLIPDVHPGTTIAGAAGTVGSMDMSAADFVVLYGSDQYREVFHAIVTVFFIDTAPNLVRYIETIRHCLKPNGTWINLGPLLWHWEDKTTGQKGEEGESQIATDDKQRQVGIGEHGSVELTEEETIALVEKMGFRIEKHELRSPACGYIQDPESMLQNLYRVSHWVAVKLR